jgi:transcriptional regulator with XRE-family HTH domain
VLKELKEQKEQKEHTYYTKELLLIMFGDSLRTLCERNYISARTLSELLGISAAQVRNYLNNESYPSFQQLLHIVVFFRSIDQQFSLEKLIDLDDPGNQALLRRLCGGADPIVTANAILERTKKPWERNRKKKPEIT